MRTVKLSEVARVERRGLHPDAISPDVAYLGLEHIERGGRILDYPTAGEADLQSTKFEFSAQHVLYGKLRPYLAKIALPDRAGVCSTDILPVLPGPELDRVYLVHYLRQESMVDFANSRAAGANLPRLSPVQLEQFPVPLPSLDEQRRIAAILDQADAIRSNRRQVLAHLDALPGNLFRSHFPSANFPRRAIGDLGRVSTGKTPPTSAPGMFEGEIPFVTPGDLESDAPVARSVTSQGAAHSRTVEPGATLVCCIGATIGKVGLASARVAFNQQINAVEWGPDVDCAYGYWATRSIRPLIVARGASTTLPLLPKSKFSELRLPVPPLEQQREFATIVDAARQPRDGVLQALAREDELFASLQARAFRGEV